MDLYNNSIHITRLDHNMTLSSFLNYLKSFDDYGAPVQVNYKGSDTFETGIGTIMSSFAKSGVISLITYENLQIMQYTIYESRNDGIELNLGENHG